VSDTDPVEITLPVARPISERFPAESDDDVATTETKKAQREGLPPGYRMRADAHYVDQLTTKRGEPARIDTSRTDATRVTRPGEAGDRPERLVSQLSDDLATIQGAIGMLDLDASPMARRVSLDLIKVQVWRAQWLLRATMLVDGSTRGPLRARPVGTMLTTLREGFAAEFRLAGLGLQVHASNWMAPVSVDEQALQTGIAGGIIATLGLVGQGEWAAVRVSIAESGGELRTVEIAQEDVAVSETVVRRFFDASWTDRPGGWAAALGAAAARTAALRHGGDATFLVGDRRGSVIRLAF
jgi:hypothetical protein